MVKARVCLCVCICVSGLPVYILNISSSLERKEADPESQAVGTAVHVLSLYTKGGRCHVSAARDMRDSFTQNAVSVCVCECFFLLDCYVVACCAWCVSCSVQVGVNVSVVCRMCVPCSLRWLSLLYRYVRPAEISMASGKIYMYWSPQRGVKILDIFVPHCSSAVCVYVGSGGYNCGRGLLLSCVFVCVFLCAQGGV